MDKWAVIFTRDSLVSLGNGLVSTLELAVTSIALSLTFGVIIGMLRLAPARAVRYPAFLYVEGLRNTPLLLIIFFTYFALPRVGISLSVYWAGVVALTIFTTALVAEIVRAGIQSIPVGQVEAARSQGMTYGQTMRYIVLPQALKKMIPPLVSQFTSLLKDTSYVMIIGGLELTQQGYLIFIEHTNPIQTLFVVACIYFVVNYSLSLFARGLERRLATEERTTVYVPESVSTQLGA